VAVERNEQPAGGLTRRDVPRRTWYEQHSSGLRHLGDDESRRITRSLPTADHRLVARFGWRKKS